VDVAYNVAAGGHVTLVGLRLGDVDDHVEEVCFAVLAAEVLGSSAHATMLSWGSLTDSAYYVIVVGEVSLAVLAPVYLGRVQVDVVGEAHVGGWVSHELGVFETHDVRS
jgi:hypothetical protein